MIKKVFSAILFYFLLLGNTFAQQSEKSVWVDSVYNTMSLEEKIGQLFMVAAYSGGNEQHNLVIEQLIRKYHIGGLIFMQGHPYSQAKLTNRYQEAAEVPLLIGMDAEWGLGMRLDSTMSYPKQMALGAINNDSLIYAMGKDIARQLKQLGVHINFAPVVDINSNPDNPVIGMRSFGEGKQLVTQKALQYMNGLQDHGIIACAKHFPGHGDTDKDSHKTLPVITHDKSRLENIELYPFQQLIDHGVKSIMSAHLLTEAYDKNNPSSLSEDVLTKLLKEQMGFNGLIISDALNMKAVADDHKQVEKEAFSAGNDILLFSQDVPGAIKDIKRALRKNKINIERLTASVKKILSAKYEVGLHHYRPVNTDNITRNINTPETKVLNLRLLENAATVVKNDEAVIPVKVLDNAYFASIDLGDSRVFNEYLDKYTFINHYNEKTFKPRHLKDFDYVMVGLTQLPDPDVIEKLKYLDDHTQLIISYFGSPYDLRPLADFNHLICTYQNDSITQMIGAEIIFGALSARGKLPVTVSDQLKAGLGQTTSSLNRLRYAMPEDSYMDSRQLADIDRIAREAIQDRATPGCQILVARHGRVVMERSYGFYTYDSLKPVNNATIYDIASITKVIASMQAFMFLEERGLVDLDKKISVFLPELKGTNKENMTFRDILTHQAGLWPYLPFWKQTIKDSLYRADFYYEELNPDYPNQVSNGLFASPVLEDSVWQWVKTSKLRKKEPRIPYDYKYSDMGYYIVQHLVEKITNQPMEEFLQQNFYDPMGMSSTSYLPLCKHPLENIAPTEKDNYFRRTLVYGMVHDQGAALLGGVAGHAGLFSNANDLAKMMYMHLNGGNYGGEQYLQPETLNKFTSQQYESNRRGIGWDKPLSGEWYGPTSEYASQKTFGHTGFTGTAVWADPEFDLIYVFLSNRIHPNAENTKLIKNNIRTRIQDVIYESIWNYQRYAGKLNE